MLLAWDAALADCNKVHRTGQVLTDREKAMARLWMMPEDLATDIYKSSHGDPSTRENYEKVRSRVDDAVYIHTSGIVPNMRKQVIGALGEADDDTVEVQRTHPDTGEVEVFAITRRNFEQAKKTSKIQNRKPPAKKDEKRDCYRCGRTGT